MTAVPGGVTTRAIDRLAFGHDASHYLLTPQAVVTPKSSDQVAKLLRLSASHGAHLTFRSGGTSLSGQATTDGLLLDTRRHFRRIEVLDGGARVRVQPGATLRAVNAALAPHRRKLGPDPASEAACTIGGVVANNSSGMACGIEANTYKTVESLVLVLPSGTVIDTGTSDADDRLRLLEPDIYAGLSRLRDRVRGAPESLQRIGRLFSIKNTMGYQVNSFADFQRPIDILAHLVVGSEGTLAFVAEATFRTVPAHPYAETAILIFPTLSEATGSLPPLVDAGFHTIELLDAMSLRVAQRDPRAVPDLAAITVDQHAALLVEFRGASPETVDDLARASDALLGGLPLAAATKLSNDSSSRTALWHIRKGLYAAIAGARPSGTTALLEDIAVPVDQLLTTCERLTELFRKHDYNDSVIFGHAKDGNIHFMLNEDFETGKVPSRYLSFTDDLVDLVLDHDGTLKAEHGTGRMMAPFVRRQYGDELFNVMREVKELIDPQGLLNPGVLLNEDPVAHVSHLKSSPTVESEVDRCVECGYCEPVCPSRDLTTTPRQRIVLRREIARAELNGDDALVAELRRDYQYEGVDTCAVDGMCATACPVLIDTGDLTRRLRTETHGRAHQRAGSAAAHHWDGVTRAASRAMTAAQLVPPSVPASITKAGRRVVPHELMPAWTADLPGGGPRRRGAPVHQADAVYLPSCTGTIFGPNDGSIGVKNAFLELCARSDVSVSVPDGIASLCCGTPWKSKGLHEGYEDMRARAMPYLREATQGGSLPVVVDASSCTEGFRAMLAPERIQVLDAVQFVDAFVLTRLPPPVRIESLVLHPTCSSTHLGIDSALLRIAAAAAHAVVVPTNWSCCGFAGDRGLLHPELTASATAHEAREVRAIGATSHASLNRTCEIAMTRATGTRYEHILEILEVVTRATSHGL
jgi:D-lactate dehydrogenase